MGIQLFKQCTALEGSGTHLGYTGGAGGGRRRRRRRRNWDHISNGTHLVGGCLITPRVVPGISTWLMRGDKQ